MAVTDNPIATGIIGALVGALLTAGGFMAFGGDSDAPVARDIAHPTESPSADETAAPEVEPKEIASGVELSFKKGTFFIKVSAADSACLEGRSWTLQRGKAKGRPEKVKSDKTNSKGLGQHKPKKPKKGNYFIRLAESDFTGEYGELNTCLKAISNKAKV
jgi:hypothetical protein